MGQRVLGFLALCIASLSAHASIVLPAPAQIPMENAILASRTSLPIVVNLDSDRHGDWSSDQLNWTISLQSDNAVALHIGFSKLALPDGSTLNLSSNLGSDKTWTAEQLKQVSWLPASIGDTATLTVSRENPNDVVDIRISQVNYGYKSGGNLQKSGSCQVSTSCGEGDGWRDEIQSAMRIDFVDSDEGSNYNCTGVLLNNTAADGSPLVLTAEHCIDTASEAQSVTVYWNYQLSSCGAAERPADTALDGVQMGATLLASWEGSDFTLLKLNQKPNDVDSSNDVHYAGWDRRDLTPNAAVTIHHPSASSKKISYEFDPLRITELGADRASFDAKFLRVADWDVGTTEVGSSGSGLWDAKRRVVGQLFGGSAACNNDEPDWFGRFSSSWEGGGTAATRLSDWLDPSGLGAECLNGSDPADLAPRLIETDCNSEVASKRNQEGATTGIEYQSYGGGGAPWGIFLVLLSLFGLGSYLRR